MIRRSFRIGLALGLLGGLAFALAKMFGARPEPLADPVPATTEPWPRLQADPARPSPPTVALVRDPSAPSAPPPAAAPVAEAPIADEPVPEAPVAEQPVAEQAAAPAPAPRPLAAKKATAKKSPAKKKAPATAWVAPKGDVCPTTHPVKAKLSSTIFHLPGMLNYARTHPDRCYRDAKAAEADGLRPSKR